MKPKSKAQWDKALLSSIRKWMKGFNCDDSYGRKSYRLFMDKIQSNDPSCNFMNSTFGEITEERCNICPLHKDDKFECCKEYYYFDSSNNLQEFIINLEAMIIYLESLTYEDYVKKVKIFNTGGCNE